MARKGNIDWDNFHAEKMFDEPYIHKRLAPVYHKVLYHCIHSYHPVIEVGCGTGVFAKFCHDNGFKYHVGIDTSHTAIKKAKKRNPELNFFHGTLHSYLKVGFPASLFTFVGINIVNQIDDFDFVMKRIPSRGIFVGAMESGSLRYYPRLFEHKNPYHLSHFKSNIKILDLGVVKWNERGRFYWVFKATKTENFRIAFTNKKIHTHEQTIT
jgi:SAM-dependent methyltransferase